jgi:hypothetical protein
LIAPTNQTPMPQAALAQLRHSAVSASLARHCENRHAHTRTIAEFKFGDTERHVFIGVDRTYSDALGGVDRSAAHHHPLARLRFEDAGVVRPVRFLGLPARTILPPLILARRSSLIRVCHPGPVLRSAARTSASNRSLIASFGFSRRGRPGGFLNCDRICGGNSSAGLDFAKSAAVHSGLSSWTLASHLFRLDMELNVHPETAADKIFGCIVLGCFRARPKPAYSNG